MKAGDETPVSIRPHDIAISVAQFPHSENVLPGTVTRQVFLGDRRDYVVELGDGTLLRVITGANEAIPQGSAVWVHLPPERCRALEA